MNMNIFYYQVVYRGGGGGVGVDSLHALINFYFFMLCYMYNL